MPRSGGRKSEKKRIMKMPWSMRFYEYHRLRSASRGHTNNMLDDSVERYRFRFPKNTNILPSLEDVESAIYNMFICSTHYNNVKKNEMELCIYWSTTEIECFTLRHNRAVDYLRALKSLYEERGISPFNNAQECEIRGRGIECGQRAYDKELKHRYAMRLEVFKLAATTAEAKQCEHHKNRVFDDETDIPHTWRMFTGDV